MFMFIFPFSCFSLQNVHFLVPLAFTQHVLSTFCIEELKGTVGESCPDPQCHITAFRRATRFPSDDKRFLMWCNIASSGECEQQSLCDHSQIHSLLHSHANAVLKKTWKLEDKDRIEARPVQGSKERTMMLRFPHEPVSI